jgi:hypothetical protein
VSRKLFAFLLSELNVVRIKCKKCGRTAEMTCEQIGSSFNDTAPCPFCGTKLANMLPENNPFGLLANAIRSFKEHANVVEVEFVLPDESPATK